MLGWTLWEYSTCFSCPSSSSSSSSNISIRMNLRKTKPQFFCLSINILLISKSTYSLLSVHFLLSHDLSTYSSISSASGWLFSIFIFDTVQGILLVAHAWHVHSTTSLIWPIFLNSVSTLRSCLMFFSFRVKTSKDWEYQITNLEIL